MTTISETPDTLTTPTEPHLDRAAPIDNQPLLWPVFACMFMAAASLAAGLLLPSRILLIIGIFLGLVLIMQLALTIAIRRSYTARLRAIEETPADSDE